MKPFTANQYLQQSNWLYRGEKSQDTKKNISNFNFETLKFEPLLRRNSKFSQSSISFILDVWLDCEYVSAPAAAQRE